VTDEKLMRYVDGELSPAECREVERELAGAPELQKKRDALLEMRDVLRARYELAESEAEPLLGDLWERVRSGLPSAPAVPMRPGVFARFRDWFETYRAHFVTGAVAATAGALVATVVTSQLAHRLPRVASGPQAAEVESLEVMGGSGMVFEEPPASQSDSGTTVIWVSANEDDDDSDDNEAPL
jgi:anti-sigma factor RsiW